ncbi:MAG: hypothetical protein IJS88_00050 [Alphaproteobacteria bacterium]|nr:hypothetical protein [Alphaproteobacteria bacterium]
MAEAAELENPAQGISSELDEDAEFRGSKEDQEDLLLTAQRYLNIFHQIHIFKAAKRKEFDQQLLEMPEKIRHILSMLPGGRILLEHIAELEAQHGIFNSSLSSLIVKKPTSDEAPATTSAASAIQVAPTVASAPVELGNDFTKALTESFSTYSQNLQKLNANIQQIAVQQQNSQIGNQSGVNINIADTISTLLKENSQQQMDVLKDFGQTLSKTILESQKEFISSLLDKQKKSQPQQIVEKVIIQSAAPTAEVVNAAPPLTQQVVSQKEMKEINPISFQEIIAKQDISQVSNIRDASAKIDNVKPIENSKNVAKENNIAQKILPETKSEQKNIKQRTAPIQVSNQIEIAPSKIESSVKETVPANSGKNDKKKAETQYKNKDDKTINVALPHQENSALHLSNEKDKKQEKSLPKKDTKQLQQNDKKGVTEEKNKSSDRSVDIENEPIDEVVDIDIDALFDDAFAPKDKSKKDNKPADALSDAFGVVEQPKDKSKKDNKPADALSDAFGVVEQPKDKNKKDNKPSDKLSDAFGIAEQPKDKNKKNTEESEPVVLRNTGYDSAMLKIKEALNSTDSVSLDDLNITPVSLSSEKEEKTNATFNESTDLEKVFSDFADNNDNNSHLQDNTDDDEWEYVDENGNPIAPSDSDEWEYVDENGNPIAPSDSDEWEYVDENGNPITPSDSDEWEYVDENGNPITPSDNDEWEYVDENGNVISS